MSHDVKLVSKKKVALVWFFIICCFVVGVIFGARGYRSGAPSEESVPWLLSLLVSMFIGLALSGLGVAAYFATLYTTCFTFRFDQPVWHSHKRKVFCANLVVPIMTVLGIGIAIRPLAAPVFAVIGVDRALANLVSVVLVVGVLQVLQLKILIWAPLEKRFIIKRLLAQGVTVPQIQSGTMVGISNPLRTSFGKGIIEDDMGVLWITGDQLVFWGDVERFAITRDQLVRFEQKGDALNSTALSGIAHVILYAKTAQGTERALRLHAEGTWTMSEKRRVMNGLADRIAKWQAAVTVVS